MSHEAVFLEFQLRLQPWKQSPIRHFENIKPEFVNTAKRKIEYSIQGYHVHHDKNISRLWIVCYLTDHIHLLTYQKLDLNYGNGKTKFLLRYDYLHYSTPMEMNSDLSQLSCYFSVMFTWTEIANTLGTKREKIPQHMTPFTPLLHYLHYYITNLEQEVLCLNLLLLFCWHFKDSTSIIADDLHYYSYQWCDHRHFSLKYLASHNVQILPTKKK